MGELEELSRREQEVLEAAGDGASTRVIAERLYISPRTVEAHLAAIYRKTGVTSRGELVALYHSTTPTATPAAPPSGPPPRSWSGVGTPENFVGRRAELDQIRSLVEVAAGGRQVLLLVGGEPGVGKTALVSRAATEAAGQGSVVLYGRSSDSAGSPFLPVADALGSYLGGHDGKLEELTGPAGGLLAPILPLLAPRLPAPPATIDGPVSPRVITEVLLDTLGIAAERAPALLVLEDIQWADHATLACIRRMAATDRTAGLVVVATFRDSNLVRSHPLPVLLADLWRERDVHRLTLHGFEVPELAELAEAKLGSAVDTSLVADLHTATSGNPFAAVQMLAEMKVTGSRRLGAVPVPVMDLIRRRLSAVGDGEAVVLEVGAVLGTRFDIDLLEATLALLLPAGTEASELIDAALATGLLRDSDRRGELCFEHDLARRAVLDDIPATKRARHQRAAGEAMLALRGQGASVPLEAAAGHFIEAGRPADRIRGAELVVEAAGEAPTNLSPDDVVALGEWALGELPPGERADEVRIDLLDMIAAAHVARFDTAGHRRAVIEAVRLALHRGDERRAAGTLDHFRLVPRMGTVDQEVLQLIDQVVDRMAEPADLRIRLAAYACYQRSFGGAGWAPTARAAQLVGEARRTGDPATLVDSLFALSGCLLGSPDTARQIEATEELVALGRRDPQAIGPADGRRLLGVAHLASGDRPAFEADLALMAADAERLRHDVLRAMSGSWRALLAIMDGDLDGAEQLAGAALAHAGEDPNFQLGWLVQVCAIRAEQDRLAEMAEILEGLAAEHGDLPAVGALIAWARHATSGEPTTDQAATLARLPGDWLLPACLAWYTPPVAAGGDRPSCLTLLSRLEPYTGQLLVVGSGTTVLGAADRFAGMLLSATGAHGEAASRFAAGAALEDSVGAYTLSAHTRLDWAAAISGSGGNAREAADLVDIASTAAAGGSAWVRARAAAFRS